MARKKKEANELIEKVETFDAEVVENARKFEPKNGVVTNCLRVNVRKEPSLAADVLCVIDLCTNVKIVDELDNWYKVEVSGHTGYTMKDYIGVIQHIRYPDAN